MSSLLALPGSWFFAFGTSSTTALIELGGIILCISTLTSVGAAGAQELLPATMRGLGAAVYSFTNLKKLDKERRRIATLMCTQKKASHEVQVLTAGVDGAKRSNVCGSRAHVRGAQEPPSTRASARSESRISSAPGKSRALRSTELGTTMHGIAAATADRRPFTESSRTR